MDKYLKMADVFDGHVTHDHDRNFITIGCNNVADFGFNSVLAAYAAHAINSHDELVGEVERLSSSLNHANSNHELFERQYYLEKDKCEDLQAEVERLRNHIHQLKSLAEHFADCGGWDVNAYSEYGNANAD